MLRTYVRLLQELSVFTIWADVLLGWIAAGGVPDLQRSAPTTWPERRWSIDPGQWHVLVNLIPLGCLLAAATCFYAAGTVWAAHLEASGNGTDQTQDILPSKRVSRLAAGLLVVIILALGSAFIVVSMTWDPFRPVGAAFALVLYIFFGHRWIGFRPLAVGICHFLNVLLGTSTSLFYVSGYPHAYYFIALIVATYMAGVSWLARDEGTRTTRSHLWRAAAVMLTASVLAYFLPTIRRSISHGLFARFEPWGIPTDGLQVALYPYFLLLWSLIIAIPVYRAIREPSQWHVHAVGRTGLLGLISLDAVLAFGVIGWPGLLILILLIPHTLVQEPLFSKAP